MKTYRVIIHYEGGWEEYVEASDADEAKEIAINRFADVPDEELIANLADVAVCDCWVVTTNKKGV